MAISGRRRSVPTPRAGRVDEHAVVVARHVARADGPVDREGGARREPEARPSSSRERSSLAGVDVARVDRAGRADRARARTRRLVPAPGARVEHRLAGARAERERDELRALLLDGPRPLGAARERLRLARAARRIASGDDAPGLERRVRRRRAEALEPRVALAGVDASTRSPSGGRLDAPPRRNARAAVRRRAIAERARAATPAPTRRVASASALGPSVSAAAACAATLRSTALANAATRAPAQSRTAVTASFTAANAGTRVKKSW